jgi:hypothetical protein
MLYRQYNTPIYYKPAPRIVGSLPATLSSLDKMEWLDFGGNDFTGLVPDLSALADLVYFDVRGSSRLNAAPIPTWVDDATLLRYL